ncbi:hypothetical protein [Undibacterium sp. Ji49W]|uniref:hypothetical protein n=1 Tax=Undibacterium sp. Ji49W TaxID=3413040 RepID=UPI003BF1C0BA
MKASKNNLLHHYMLMREAIRTSEAEAILNFDTFELFIRKANNNWILYPKFLATINGTRQYTSNISTDINMFAGWLPYKNKHWPIASNKLEFKRFASTVNLPVPEYAVTQQSSLEHVLIKRLNSSFGAQILGPFHSATERQLHLENGEYFEKFIEGDLLKIWYWNGQAVCMERDSMPTVVGDGVATIGELIIRRGSQVKWLSVAEKNKLLKNSETLLTYFKVNAKTVLKKGKTQMVEFRYGSDIMHPNERKIIDIQSTPPKEILTVIEDTGIRLQAAIPQAIRTNTLFTVDAIVDKDNQVWLLEMNCNPAVHPYVYPVMAGSIVI